MGHGPGYPPPIYATVYLLYGLCLRCTLNLALDYSKLPNFSWYEITS